MYEKVLFPTDFSESAQKTIECIGDIPGVKEVVTLSFIKNLKGRNNVMFATDFW